MPDLPQTVSRPSHVLAWQLIPSDGLQFQLLEQHTQMPGPP